MGRQKLTIPCYWVDAFTAVPFGGNPAAVCISQTPLEDSLMQRLAKEFGLSETAFLWPEGPEWNLRWFTPAAEVRLCGHATVAAATALWSHFGGELDQELCFQTLSGRLLARKLEELIELSFPARPPKECPAPGGLLEGLALSESQVQWCGRDADDYLLVLESEREVKELQPDFVALLEVETRGTIVTAPSETPHRDFVSRFFAPRVGVDEDPVTGSAHCCLTPYWSDRLNTTVLSAEQLSERGGQLEVELLNGRVLLRGRSFLLMQGELNLPL